MLTESQIERLEERLIEEREAATRLVRELSRDIERNATSDGDLSKVPTHLADQASDVQEEETDTGIAERNTYRIALIDDALRRLRETPGDFDVSEVSGLTIPFERLEMVPWTRVLAGEAEVEESPGGGGTREEQRSREAAQQERRGPL